MLRRDLVKKAWMISMPFLFSGYSYAQIDSTAVKYAQELSADEIKKHLEVIASDAFEGRETGEKGQKMAASYIAQQMDHLGLKGVGDSLDYYQRFNLYHIPKDKARVIVANSDSLDLFTDFYSFSALTDTIVAGETVFLGYGIDDENYSNYGDDDYSGKIGVILVGEPKSGGKFLLTDTEQPSSWSTEQGLKLNAAKARGLAGLVVLQGDFNSKSSRAAYFLSRRRLQIEKHENTALPVVNMDIDFAKKLFPKIRMAKIKTELNEGKGLVKAGKSQLISLEYYGEVETLISENVIGMIPGSDLSDEYVFITAHYDHLGKREEGVFNGADDDGSGTTGVMDMMRVMTRAYHEGNGPRRSMVFLFVSGEEKGLLGSEYYTEHPLIPLENTVTDLNIDMIGRRDTEHLNTQDKYIYLIGSDKLSMDLHRISEWANKSYCQFEIDYVFNDEEHPSRLYYRSDHYNFAKHDIPVIFYFRGIHEDYHTVNDTVDKIEFGTIEDVMELVFYTAWEVANRDERLKLD